MNKKTKNNIQGRHKVKRKWERWRLQVGNETSLGIYGNIDCINQASLVENYRTRPAENYTTEHEKC